MRHETELTRQILKSPSAQRMIDYVSPIYGEDYAALWLFEIMGRALDSAEEIGESLWDQTVPQTATWALPYWEEEYGVTPDPSWTIEQRQANILARIQYTAPVNPAKLAALAAAAAGVPCEIVENVAKNTFSVVLHGTTNTLGRVKAVLDETKPAHLIPKFITQIEIIFPNPQDRFLLRRMSFAYRFRSYGGTFILLDGKRQLDGTWKLGQAASGARMIRIDYRVRLLEKGALWPGTWGCVTAVQTAQRAVLPSLGIRPASPWQTGEALSVPKLQVQSAWRERQAFGAGVSWNGGRSRNQQRLEQPSTRVAGTFQTPEALSAPRIHIETTFQTKEHFSGTLTRDQTWSFDGTYRWDGTKQFNAGITKEDL